jgi:hypothetical protein
MSHSLTESRCTHKKILQIWLLVNISSRAPKQPKKYITRQIAAQRPPSQLSYVDSIGRIWFHSSTLLPLSSPNYTVQSQGILRLHPLHLLIPRASLAIVETVSTALPPLEGWCAHVYSGSFTLMYRAVRGIRELHSLCTPLGGGSPCKISYGERKERKREDIAEPRRWTCPRIIAATSERRISGGRIDAT